MKKKLDCPKMLRSWLRRFTANPVEFAVKIGLTLTVGDYSRTPLVQPLIAQAMAFWMSMNPQSAFYEKLEIQLRKKANETKTHFDWEQYKAERQIHADTVKTDVLPLIGTDTGNKYFDALCMYMLLPSDVARKWLWHENVDFQSVESFLRRITKEQFDSLERHYSLVKGGEPTNNLPCFNDGVLNKMWRFFKPTFKEQPRMATKAAIAYNFLGMDMGFKLYPDVVKDDKLEQELAAQFLSKRSRGSGDFEVNKEHGGLYWLLYRLWHSNALYGGGKEVEFGRWVCPGFWFTMIFWGVLALLSPMCLVAGMVLHTVYGVTSVALFSVGSILPVVMTAIAVKKVCGKTYNEGYWKRFLLMVLVWMVGVVVYQAITYLQDFPSFYMGMVSMVFLVPFCLEKETGAFWRAPVMGKLFPILFLFVLGWDLSQHSMFFEACWSVVTAIGGFFSWLFLFVVGFLYDERWTILKWTLLVVAYGACLYGLVRMGDWVSKKSDAMIAKDDVCVNEFQNGVIWFVGIFCVLFLAIAYTYVRGMGFSALPMLGGFLTAMMIPLFVLFVSFLTVNSVDRKVQRRVTRITGGYYGVVALKAISVATASNPFWADVAFSSRRAKMLNELSEYAPEPGRSQFAWFIAMVSSVKSDDELRNMVKFYLLPAGLRWRLRFSVTPCLLELIFAGASEEVLRQAINDEEGRLAEVERLREPSVQQKLAGWVVNRLVPFFEYVAKLLVSAWKAFVFTLKVVTWPIRALWKGVWDLYHIWESFQKQCPPAPPNERPLAQ